MRTLFILYIDVVRIMSYHEITTEQQPPNKEDKIMKYRIDTLHKKNGKEVYMVSRFLSEDGSLTINMFPGGKVFQAKEEAEKAAEEAE